MTTLYDLFPQWELANFPLDLKLGSIIPPEGLLRVLYNEAKQSKYEYASSGLWQTYFPTEFPYPDYATLCETPGGDGKDRMDIKIKKFHEEFQNISTLVVIETKKPKNKYKEVEEQALAAATRAIDYEGLSGVYAFTMVGTTFRLWFVSHTERILMPLHGTNVRGDPKQYIDADHPLAAILPYTCDLIRDGILKRPAILPSQHLPSTLTTGVAESSGSGENFAGSRLAGYTLDDSTNDQYLEDVQESHDHWGGPLTQGEMDEGGPYDYQGSTGDFKGKRVLTDELISDALQTPGNDEGRLTYGDETMGDQTQLPGFAGGEHGYGDNTMGGFPQTQDYAAGEHGHGDNTIGGIPRGQDYGDGGGDARREPDPKSRQKDKPRQERQEVKFIRKTHTFSPDEIIFKDWKGKDRTTLARDWDVSVQDGKRMWIYEYRGITYFSKHKP